MPVKRDNAPTAGVTMGDNPFRRMVELSSTPMMVHRDFRPLVLNDAYVRLFNLGSAEAVLQRGTIEHLIAPDFLETARQRYQRGMQGEDLGAIRHEMLDADGRRLVIEFQDALIDWHGEPALFTNLVDVTRDVRDQQSLSRMTADLRSALGKAEREQQLRARFLARMSHELRTPLTTIFSAFDLMHMTPLSAKQDHYVEMARNAAVHLRLLIDNLFEFTRIADDATHHQDESFLLGSVLTELVDRYAAMARDRKVRLLADVPADVQTGVPAEPQRLLRGNRAGLTRILANLVENGLKVAAHGTIRLTGRLRPGETEDQYVASVTVAIHTGQRSKGDEGGADMTTSVASDIADKVIDQANAMAHPLGHRIAFESLPQGGSAFTLSVTLSCAPIQSSADRDGEAEDAGDLRVLLVEDQPVNQDLIREMLSTMGYRVEVADTGEDAIDRANSARFDVVLMDRRLPGIDGFEAAERMRTEINPCPPIILLTADATCISDEELSTTPFAAFVTKPIDWSTLDEEIRGAAGR